LSSYELKRLTQKLFLKYPTYQVVPPW
jgi:hypothetical protein